MRSPDLIRDEHVLYLKDCKMFKLYTHTHQYITVRFVACISLPSCSYIHTHIGSSLFINLFPFRTYPLIVCVHFVILHNNNMLRECFKFVPYSALGYTNMTLTGVSFVSACLRCPLLCLALVLLFWLLTLSFFDWAKQFH